MDKSILSAQAWNEIPIDALPAACLEARRTTERGVPMDSEVVRAYRRLSNSKPSQAAASYSGRVDISGHERAAETASRARGERFERCSPDDRMNREEHTACIRIAMGMIAGKIPPDWGKESVRLLAERRVTAQELMAELATVA